jgi:hypothetical protein
MESPALQLGEQRRKAPPRPRSLYAPARLVFRKMLMVNAVGEEGRVAALPIELPEIDLREIGQELNRIETAALDHPVGMA